MPQRQFWTERHPVSVVWRYTTDLVHPEAPTALYCAILDQEHKPMESATASVGHLVTHEAIATILSESWEAYLFGEHGSMTRAVHSCSGRWRIEQMARQERVRGGLPS